MTELHLYGLPVGTVFELLGNQENDITKSIGWALAQSPAFLLGLLQDLFPRARPGSPEAVRLQEPYVGSGYTDIEVQTDALHLIVEAKRGWASPERSQLEKYLVRFKDDGHEHAFVVMAEASEAFARESGRLPTDVNSVPVFYRSWKQVARIASQCRSKGTHAEKHLLDELCLYIKGLMSMQ